MANVAHTWLAEVPLGTRVVVRHLIESGDRATDALGTLTAHDGTRLEVLTRQGPVQIAVSAVVAAKPVPPPPARRRTPPPHDGGRSGA